MELIEKRTTEAVEKIQSSWRISVESILATATLILKYSNREDWSDIQQQLNKDGMLKASVISMMITIAQSKILTNPDNLHLLPSAYNTLYQLAKLSDSELESRIKAKELSPSLLLKEARVWYEGERKHSQKSRDNTELLKILIPTNLIDGKREEVADLIVHLEANHPYLILKRTGNSLC